LHLIHGYNLRGRLINLFLDDGSDGLFTWRGSIWVLSRGEWKRVAFEAFVVSDGDCAILCPCSDGPVFGDVFACPVPLNIEGL
jgi:hypothetical protein